MYFIQQKRHSHDMRLTMESDYINTIVWILLIVLPEALGQHWSFSFPQSIQALKGSCVEIPCSYTRPRTLKPPKVMWYIEGQRYYYTVFNSQDRTAALDTYVLRTKHVPDAINSCTLHISNVRSDDEGSYIPGVDDTDAYNLNGTTMRITVIDAPYTINLQGPTVMTEGIPVAIRCSVEHTCGSDPPTLRWNKRQYLPRTGKQYISEGRWEAISEITYSPTYEDDETEIQCSATYPNGQTSHNAAPLNIIYAPREVQIVMYEREDGGVDLKCSFSSSRPNVTQFTWLRNDVPMITRAEPIITLEKAEENAGEYRCIAHNKAGNSSSDKQVAIQFNDVSTSTINYINYIRLGIGILIVLLTLFIVILHFRFWKNIKSTDDGVRPYFMIKKVK
uniref:Ig-like domain-containing protein n=1 Tax=Xenopus tropicalis TaxID=8364 RepID=A0A803K7T9_XENTR